MGGGLKEDGTEIRDARSEITARSCIPYPASRIPDHESRFTIHASLGDRGSVTVAVLHHFSTPPSFERKLRLPGAVIFVWRTQDKSIPIRQLRSRTWQADAKWWCV